MARFKEDRRNELQFVAGSLDTMLPDHSIARVLWHLLESLDFSEFEAAFKNDALGRRAIDPRCVAAVILLGLVRGVTSSVKLAQLCEQNIEFRWISGDVSMEKSTLCDFRKNNLNKLSALGAQVLSALSANGLLPGENMGVDGTIIRAAASRHARRSRKSLEKGRQRLERVLQEKLEGADTQKEDEKARMFESRKQRLERALQDMDALGLKGEKDQLTITEPGAKLRKQKDGSFAPGYNAQVVTDLGSGAIVSAQIVDGGNDSGQLQPQLEQARSALCEAGQNKSIRSITADGAYHDIQQLSTLEDAGIACYVPDIRNTNRQAPGVAEEYHASAFEYDPASDTLRCPQGHDLRRRKLNRAQTATVYEAPAKACDACPAKANCCPASKSGRNVSRMLDKYQQTAATVSQRLETETGQQRIWARWTTGEGTFARLLDKLDGRRNRMWDKLGAQAELAWRQLAHNLMLLSGLWKPLIRVEPAS